MLLLTIAPRSVRVAACGCCHSRVTSWIGNAGGELMGNWLLLMNRSRSIYWNVLVELGWMGVVPVWESLGLKRPVTIPRCEHEWRVLLITIIRNRHWGW